MYGFGATLDIFVLFSVWLKFNDRSEVDVIWNKATARNLESYTGMNEPFIIEALRFERLAQERRNSSALAMEICLFCTNPSIWW